MTHKTGDIVRALQTFSMSHIFEGHEYTIVDVMPCKDTVLLNVPTHRDKLIEVWTGYVKHVRRPNEWCMFGGET